MNPKSVLRGYIENGVPLVKVPLANKRGLYATVDEATFDAWVAAGGTTRWIINGNGQGTSYVRCYQSGVAGELALVARLLTGAGRGQVVRYGNGDRLDLRAANLSLTGGAAKGQTRRGKPANLVIPPPPVAYQPRPSGTMGTPEPSSGYAFAPL